MRLICPNCGAQYEVADDVIPAAGRDVQCSNCSHTWFEQPGRSEVAEFGVEPSPEVPEPEPQYDPAPVAEPEPAEPAVAARDPWDRTTFSRPPPARRIEPEMPPATPAPVEPAPFIDVPDLDAPATFADAPPPGFAAETGPEAEPGSRGQFSRPPMRTLTPDVAEILREEAAREEAARKAEAAVGLQTQSELPLDPPAAADLAPDDDARGRIARMMAASAAAQQAVAAEPPPPAAVHAPPVIHPRRDLLPDIEEINSTLRSATERGPVAAEQVVQEEEANKRGFRYGFSVILLVAAALAVVYVYTPRIIVMVPEAEPILTPYADAVDNGRLWLDLRLQDLLEVIDPSPDPATDAAQPPAEG